MPILQQVKLCRDGKDDKFIELALNGDASYLISGDDDLLVLEKIQDVSIVNFDHFLDFSFDFLQVVQLAHKVFKFFLNCSCGNVCVINEF